MGKKTLVLELDTEDYKVLKVFKKEKKDKIVQSKLTPVSDFSEETKDMLDYLEMCREFYSDKGPAYKKAREILEAYVLINFPVSTAQHLAGGYDPKFSTHDQIVKKHTPIDVISVEHLQENINEYYEEGTEYDALTAVYQLAGVQKKARAIMRELHFGPQMATYSAARHLINEIIESFKDDFPKYYSVLKFTYQNPETAHLLVKEKADLYSRLTGCGEKTYRYTLHDSIIEFAKALWGPLPDINKTDIFAVEDGHIDFVRHITTELFDY